MTTTLASLWMSFTIIPATRSHSNFNLLAPGYYYRQNMAGGFSDASACGNETASERPMMRKFIVESVKFWAGRIPC